HLTPQFLQLNPKLFPLTHLLIFPHNTNHPKGLPHSSSSFLLVRTIVYYVQFSLRNLSEGQSPHPMRSYVNFVYVPSLQHSPRLMYVSHYSTDLALLNSNQMFVNVYITQVIWHFLD